MAKEINYIICPGCGKKTIGPNLFGKLCLRCGYDIPPTDNFELPLVADNKRKDIEFLGKFRESINRRFLEKKNGNKN